MELRIWCLLAAFCVGITSAVTPTRRDAINIQRQQRLSRRTFSAEEIDDYDQPLSPAPKAEDETTPKPSSYSRRVDGASNIARIRSRTGRARLFDPAYDTFQKFERSQLNTEERKKESSDAPTSYAEVKKPNTRSRGGGNLRTKSYQTKIVDPVNADLTAPETVPAVVENRTASIFNARTRSRLQTTRSTTSTTTVEPETTSPNFDESKIVVVNSNLEDITRMTFRDVNSAVLKTTEEEESLQTPKDSANPFNPSSSSAPALETTSDTPRKRVRVLKARKNIQVNQTDRTTALEANSEKLLEASTKIDKEIVESGPTATSDPGAVLRNSRRLRYKPRQDSFSSNAAEENVPAVKKSISFAETVRSPIKTNQQETDENGVVQRRRSFTRRVQAKVTSTESTATSTSTESSNVSKRVPIRGRTNFRPKKQPSKKIDSNSEIDADDNYPASFKALLQAKTSTPAENSAVEELATRGSQRVQNVITPSAVDDSSNVLSASTPKFTRRRVFKPPAVASSRSDRENYSDDEDFAAKPSLPTTSYPGRKNFSRRPSYSSRIRQSTTTAKITTPTLDSSTTIKPIYKFTRQQKSFRPKSFKSGETQKESDEPNEKPNTQIKFQRPNVLRSNFLLRPKTTSTEKPESLENLDNSVITLDTNAATPIIDTSAQADTNTLDNVNVTSKPEDVFENQSKLSKYHSRYKSGANLNNIVLPPRKSFTVTKSSAEVARSAHRNLYRGRSTTPLPADDEKEYVIKNEVDKDNLSKITKAAPNKIPPGSFKSRFSARYRAPAPAPRPSPKPYQATVPPFLSTAAGLREDNEINSNLDVMSYSQTRSTISSADLKLSESVWTPAHTPFVETSHSSPSATISIYEALADILTSTPKSTTIKSDIGVSNPVTSAATKPVQSEMQTESTMGVTNDVTMTTHRSRAPIATILLYSTTLSPPPTTDSLTTHTSEAPSSTETLATVFNTKSISDLILSLNTNISSELTSMLSNNIKDIMIDMDEGLRSKVTVDMDEIFKSLTTTPLTPNSEFDSTSFTLEPDTFTDVTSSTANGPSSAASSVDSTVTDISLETTLSQSTHTTAPLIDAPISTVASFIMNYDSDSVTQLAPLNKPLDILTDYPSTIAIENTSDYPNTFAAPNNNILTEYLSTLKAEKSSENPTTLITPTNEPQVIITKYPSTLKIENFSENPTTFLAPINEPQNIATEYPSTLETEKTSENPSTLILPMNETQTIITEYSSTLNIENSSENPTTFLAPTNKQQNILTEYPSTLETEKSTENPTTLLLPINEPENIPTEYPSTLKIEKSSETPTTFTTTQSLTTEDTMSPTIQPSVATTDTLFTLSTKNSFPSQIDYASLDDSQTQTTTVDPIENVMSIITSIKNHENVRQGRVKDLDETAVGDLVTNTESPSSTTPQVQTVNSAKSSLFALLQSFSSTNNDTNLEVPCIISPAELWGLSRRAKILKVIEEMIKLNNIESITTISPSTIPDNISNHQAKQLLNSEVPIITVPDASASTLAREELTSASSFVSTETSPMTVTNLSLNTDASTDETTTISTAKTDDLITIDKMDLTTVATVQQATESPITTGNANSLTYNLESTMLTTNDVETSVELQTFDNLLPTSDLPSTKSSMDNNSDEELTTTEQVTAITENVILTTNIPIATEKILTATDNPTTTELLLETTTDTSATTNNVKISETNITPAPPSSTSTTPTYSWVPPFPTAWRNSSQVSASSSPVKKDYFIFGILQNNTVVRKNPNDDTLESLTEASPYIIFGLLPNNTVVRKFPNGTRVPRLMQKIEVLPIDPRSLRNPLHPIYRNPALIKPISNPIQEITTNDITLQTNSTEIPNRAAIEAQLNGVNVNNTQQMISSSFALNNTNDQNKNVNTDSSLTTITTENAADTNLNVISLLTTSKSPSVNEILLNSIALATMEEENKASMVTSTSEPRILTLDIDPETKRIRTERPTEENGNAVFKFIPINNNIPETDKSSNVFKLEKSTAFIDTATEAFTSTTNAPSVSTENIVRSTLGIQELGTTLTSSSTTESSTFIPTTTESIATTTTVVPTTARSTTTTETTTTETTTTEFIPPSTRRVSFTTTTISPVETTMTTPFEKQTTTNGPQIISEDLATTSTLISMATDNLVAMTTDSPVTFQSRRIAANKQSVTTNKPTTSTYSVADDIAFLKSLKMYVNPDDADKEASLANRIIALAVERSLSELTPNKTSVNRTAKRINGNGVKNQIPLTTLATTTTTTTPRITTTIRTTQSIEDNLKQYEADAKLLQALLSATGKSQASFNLPSLLSNQLGKSPTTTTTTTTTTPTTTTKKSSTIPPSIEDDIRQYEKDAKLLQALLKATGQSTSGINIPSLAWLNTLADTTTTAPKTTITTRIPMFSTERSKTTGSIEDDIRQYEEDAKLLQALLKATGQSTSGFNIPSLSGLNTLANTRKPITTTTTTTTTPKTTTTATRKPTVSIENDKDRQYQEEVKLLRALLSATGQSAANPNVIGANSGRRPLKVPKNVQSDLKLLENLLLSPSPLNTDEVNEQLLKQLANNARIPNKVTIDSKPDNSESQLRVKPLDRSKTTPRTVTTTSTLKPLISDDIKNFQEDKKLLQTLLKLQSTGSNKLPVNNKVAVTGFTGDETLAALLAQEEKEKTVTKSPMPLSTEFGKTSDALLAALLKEQGFGPTTPGSIDEQLKFAALLNQVVVTPKSRTRTTTTTTPPPPPPPSRAARPLLDGLSWLWNQWQETAPAPGTRRPRPAPSSSVGGGGAGSWFGSGPFVGNADDPPALPIRGTTNGNRILLQPPGSAEATEAGTAPAPARPQLVSAAINVTRAFSQFLGAAIQGAAATVQNVIKAGQKAATDVYSTGSG